LSGKFKWEATYLAESTRAIRRLVGLTSWISNKSVPVFSTPCHRQWSLLLRFMRRSISGYRGSER